MNTSISLSEYLMKNYKNTAEYPVLNEYRAKYAASFFRQSLANPRICIKYQPKEKNHTTLTVAKGETQSIARKWTALSNSSVPNPHFRI